MGKYKRPRPKVGTFVKIKESAYRHIDYVGMVTESFENLTILYGVNHRGDLDYHRIDEERIEVTKLEMDQFRFEFDQAVRDIEARKLKAEHSYHERMRELNVALIKRKEIFGIETKPWGVE